MELERATYMVYIHQWRRLRQKKTMTDALLDVVDIELAQPVGFFMWIDDENSDRANSITER